MKMMDCDDGSLFRPEFGLQSSRKIANQRQKSLPHLWRKLFYCNQDQIIKFSPKQSQHYILLNVSIQNVANKVFLLCCALVSERKYMLLEAHVLPPLLYFNKLLNTISSKCGSGIFFVVSGAHVLNLFNCSTLINF